MFNMLQPSRTDPNTKGGIFWFDVSVLCGDVTKCNNSFATFVKNFPLDATLFYSTVSVLILVLYYKQVYREFPKEVSGI